jgi:5-enolpyruvylshikimate-3-phosphate synthase
MLLAAMSMKKRVRCIYLHPLFIPEYFHSYEDHRLATAGAMIGLVVNGIEVENIETTNKTLPDFPGQWSELLGN